MYSHESIPNWLIKRAYLTPNRLAISFYEKKMTFQELKSEVEKTVRKLAFLQIKKASRVAVLLNNHLDTVVILHALQWIGCESILLNIRLQDREVLFQIKDSEAEFLITEEQLIERFPDTKAYFHSSAIVKEDLFKSKELDITPLAHFKLDDVCTMMYTSGTTGFPKGVLQTYRNHWSSAIGSALNLGVNEKDAWLLVVPLFHISGYSILVRSVIYGIPIVLFDTFDEDKVNKALIKGKATIISVVTTMLQRMIEQLGEARYHPTFRCMLLGGGSAPLSLLEVCKEKGVPVFQTYGMTETASQIVTLSPEDSLTKLGSAGKPLFLSDVRIENKGRQARIGEIGEILVKGPNVTPGYYKRNEANMESFTDDGWFYTGDVGYIDEEGFLFVVDRRSDLIISGGENIYPAEIEHIIQAHPAIQEVAVIGQKDEKWGEVPCAFYTIKEGAYLTHNELTEFCRARIANYKIPKNWIQIDELPKTASSKIKRKDLKKLLNEC